MLEFKIWSVDTVKEVCDRFAEKIGGKLHIFSGNKEVAENEKVSSIEGITSILNLGEQDTVKDFVDKCYQQCKIKVKIRTNDDWVLVPDNVPLKLLRNLPKQATKSTIEKYISQIEQERKDRLSELKTADNLYDKMFPLYRVTPNKTTLKEIEKMGYNVDYKDKSSVVHINGIAFWDHDDKKTIGSLYMTYSDEMPSDWKEYIGFDWKLSYNGWLSLLKRLGCEISVIENPKRESYDSSWTLSALVKAKSKDNRIILRLNFNYQKLKTTGSMLDSPATLYSLSIDIDRN